MAVADEPTGKLKIVIMNTNGRKKSDNIVNKPQKKKQVICDVVQNTGATLFLFQEFMWTGISGRAWAGEYSLPSHLEYIGNKEACILFHKDKVTVEEVPQTGIQESILKRMCIRKVKTIEVPNVEFICISWHGRQVVRIKIKEFKGMLEYISKLSKDLVLPVLLAGDFNLKTKEIKKYLPSLSLVLHKYEPTERRKSENIIDFFIASESLEMSGIKALALESETKVAEVLSLFDHDPVVSFMSTKTENKDSLISKMSKLSVSSLTSDTDTTSSEISAEVED
jgi:hypothetical protein